MVKSNLPVLLAQRRMKMYQLAQEAGISRNTVSAIYNDHWKMVSRGVLDAICGALRIQPGDLLEYVPDEPEG